MWGDCRQQLTFNRNAVSFAAAVPLLSPSSPCYVDALRSISPGTIHTLLWGSWCAAWQTVLCSLCCAFRVLMVVGPMCPFLWVSQGDLDSLLQDFSYLKSLEHKHMAPKRASKKLQLPDQRCLRAAPCVRTMRGPERILVTANHSHQVLGRSSLCLPVFLHLLVCSACLPVVSVCAVASTRCCTSSRKVATERSSVS